VRTSRHHGGAGLGPDADHDVPGDAGHGMAVTHVVGPADPHLTLLRPTGC
jgi:hypothetical protein